MLHALNGTRIIYSGSLKSEETRTCIYNCMYIYYTHAHTHAHTRTRTRTRTSTRTHTHTHAHSRTRTHARTHARTHTHTHTRTHARTHARTHSLSFVLRLPDCRVVDRIWRRRPGRWRQCLLRIHCCVLACYDNLIKFFNRNTMVIIGKRHTTSLR